MQQNLYGTKCRKQMAENLVMNIVWNSLADMVMQVGAIKPGCFKVGNTGGMLDNILASKLYRPGRLLSFFELYDVQVDYSCIQLLHDVLCSEEFYAALKYG